MPRLTPQTHETFAELVAAGNPLPESAFAAGLKWNPSYARKLARRPEIIQRIAELSKREQAIKLKRDGPDEDFILTQLARNLYLARQALDMKTANATLELIGKHFGMFSGRAPIRKPGKDAPKWEIDAEKLLESLKKLNEMTMDD